MRTLGLAALLLTLTIGPTARANQDAIQPALDLVKEKYNIDMKKLFSTNCSWCHQGMGMKTADGPKLAGTEKTRDQLIKQIKKGKSPMPGFEKHLKPEEVEALADYILALPK